MKKRIIAVFAAALFFAQIGFAADSGADVKSGTLDPQKTYEIHCVVCHSSGVAGAPKFGDTSAWTALLEATGKTNYEDQLSSVADIAMEGKGAMPPKGTCTECEKADIEAITNYMVKGGKGS